MRLFAAIDVPDEVRRSCASAVAREDPRVRWTEPRRWHVTTAFYGELPDDRLGDLASRLERAARRTRPLRVALDGLSGFPSLRRARVVVIRVAGADADELARLAERCVAAGRRLALDMEDRAYRPHLTIGRARDPVDLTPLAAGFTTRSPALEWTAHSLVLVHSTLGPRPQYEVVGRWELVAHQA